MRRDVSELTMNVSKILSLLENRTLPREESVQKTEIEYDPWTIKI